MRVRDDRMDNDLNTDLNYNFSPAEQHINNTKQLLTKTINIFFVNKA